MAKTKRMRLNIYIADSLTRKQIKINAARHDLSISEYCLRAIRSQLAKDKAEKALPEEAPALQGAVKRARRFRSKKFKGRIFSKSSAELIREARQTRAGG